MAEAWSLRLEEQEWEQVDPKLRKRAVHADLMTLTRYSFEPGGRFPHHVHDQEQLTYVLAGEVTFRVDGVDHELSAGGLVVIPSSVPHSAEAGTEGAEVLSVVAPARIEGRGIQMLGGA